MSEVFLSYRQTDDEQKQRVRAFAERLRDREINVFLDQFLEDDKPSGPGDRWAKWSADRAFQTKFVLIIGTRAWFECFDGKHQPGTGLGATYEASAIRQRIYEAGGMNNDIRVVLFDAAEAALIPAELRGYQHFYADRDFVKIVRWLEGKLIIDTPRTSIPHNLPSLQPFFGREEELKKIADALDPESRTWGALIHGPGGMGKTSLAVRAAYDVSPDAFEKIVFISLKSRVLDDDGERDLSGFLISGWAELLNELARELGHDAIAKAPENQRPHLLHDALRGTRTLLVLDNLESLVKRERDIVFTFVDKLPLGCKAILTARGRIGAGGREIILQELSQQAALATIAKLAEDNPALRRASEAERLLLYRETGGNPLLLRWTAGQIGRGSCLTFADAIAYLRSCPQENDPLEFIFGDLLETFSDVETRVICALTYFTLPANIEHVFEFAESSQAEVDRAFRNLVNRSVVVPNEDLTTFTLVPLVADFLRKKNPGVVAEIGDKLEKRASALVVDNGYNHYDRFPNLDMYWPTIAASLPRFLSGASSRLQALCNALDEFLNFTGRWDELLALNKDAERRAVTEQEFLSAGWRAYHAGWVYRLRGQPAELLACADRVQEYWHKAKAGTREKASALQLRASGHTQAGDYAAAIAVQCEAVEEWRTLERESTSTASALNDLGDIERLSGDLDSAERDYGEALRIARVKNDHEGIATYLGNLALLMLDREDWSRGEALAREALSLAEKIRRRELIALSSQSVAYALLQQEKKADALPHAQRAVEIFKQLGSPNLTTARDTLNECES